MDFEAELHSLERSERMSAEDWHEKAEGFRDDLADMPRMWPQGAPEMETQLARQRVADAEARALVSSRRADYASAGYMFLSESEHRDPEYMRRHQAMIGVAHARGRVKHGRPLEDREDFGPGDAG